MYSDKLIEKVKSLHSDSDKIITLAITHNKWLGKYLEDSCGEISLDEIIESKDLALLKQKAELIKQKKELYSDWCKEYYATQL